MHVYIYIYVHAGLMRAWRKRSSVRVHVCACARASRQASLRASRWTQAPVAMATIPSDWPQLPLESPPPTPPPALTYYPPPSITPPALARTHVQPRRRRPYSPPPRSTLARPCSLLPSASHLLSFRFSSVPSVLHPLTSPRPPILRRRSEAACDHPTRSSSTILTLRGPFPHHECRTQVYAPVVALVFLVLLGGGAFEEGGRERLFVDRDKRKLTLHRIISEAHCDNLNTGVSTL